MVKVCCNQSTSLLRETHTVQIDDGPLADVWKRGNGAENFFPGGRVIHFLFIPL